MWTALTRAGAAFLVSCASCALLPACSSDAAPEPEPELETPGAFTAVDEAEASGGPLTLYRTLDTLILANDTIVFVTVYDVEPSSWEEAREMARERDVPIRLEIQFISRSSLIAHPFRVVWFRTLTDEEKERIP
ncbi:MAG TPA: hypothetical protein VE093_46515 [Polyangiaceae bacterium]|nr:hypothetical protein [Polyangiaceae bacterium]